MHGRARRRVRLRVLRHGGWRRPALLDEPSAYVCAHRMPMPPWVHGVSLEAALFVAPFPMRLLDLCVFWTSRLERAISSVARRAASAFLAETTKCDGWSVTLTSALFLDVLSSGRSDLHTVCSAASSLVVPAEPVHGRPDTCFPPKRSRAFEDAPVVRA